MAILLLAVIAGMIPMIPAVIYFLRVRGDQPVSATKGLLMGLNGFNAVVGLMAAGLGIVWLATPSAVSAAVFGAQAAPSDPYASLGAAIATGLATVGAGIGVSGTGAAAIGAIAEKPDFFGRALIFVGLAEGIAIYGLLISFLLLNR
jgi:V/A-type H+-transporting ATPase subunit K